jgi:hypothetical protein
MLQLQPDKDNIFRRKLKDLRDDKSLKGNEAWIQFKACKLTLQSMRDTLFLKKPSELQQKDLSDYEEALIDIRICFYNLSVGDLSTKYRFSNVLAPLQKAIIFVDGASGIKNNHSIARNQHIQNFLTFLNMTLEQIEGPGIPP